MVGSNTAHVLGHIMKVWNWIKENVAAALSILGAILGVAAAYRYHKNKVGSLKDAVKVEKAKKDIARAEASKEAKLKEATSKELEVKKLDEKVQASKRRVVELETKVEGLSDEEVADEFQRLGY